MYALVTGATSGIGRAFACKFAREGYDLVLVGRNNEKLEDLKNWLVEAYNIRVQAYVVDLKYLESVDGLAESLRKKGIILEMVINNAGIGSYGSFGKIEKEEDMDVIDINVRAFTYLVKVLLPDLPRGATILQVASTAAFAPGPYMAVYYASKAYVLSLSMAIREELRQKGIQVNVLCPGPTKTAFQTRAKMKKAEFAQNLAMDPEQVVEEAYRGILKNKAIIVPGFMNKLAVLGMRCVPLSIATKLVACTQNKE